MSRHNKGRRTVFLPEEFWDEAKKAAAAQGIPVSTVFQLAWHLAKDRIALTTPKKRARRQLQKRWPRWTE